MRKFFCISAGLAACSVAGLATAGGPQLQSIQKGTELKPIRMAQISPEGKLVSPWVYTKDLQGVDSNCGDDLLFDGFDYNTADGGPENGDLCGSSLGPSSRWFFGSFDNNGNFSPDYCATWTVNDITSMAPGANGLTSDHTKFAWFNYGAGDPNGTEQTFVVIFTYEDFDDTCTGPPASNPYNGIIFDFGVQGTNGSGYAWTNINDLCASGLSFQMPVDGVGAYDMQFWNFFDGTNFTFSQCVQPMFWGQRDTAVQGSSSTLMWSDDTAYDANGNCTADINGNCLNTPDGAFDPQECYTWSFGVCPDPLNSMLSFQGTLGPTSCLTLDVDQLIGGLTSTFTLGNGTQGEVGAIVYGLKAGTTKLNGQFGYCATFGIKGLSPDSLLIQKKFDANGVITKNQAIPVSAVGKQVLFQGAQRDTCVNNTECVSNLLDMVVQ